MAGGNVGGYHNMRHPKPKTIVELQETLQMIWDSLPRGPINKDVKKFPKSPNDCFKANGGHFEKKSITVAWQRCNADNLRQCMIIKCC